MISYYKLPPSLTTVLTIVTSREKKAQVLFSFFPRKAKSRMTTTEQQSPDEGDTQIIHPVYCYFLSDKSEK